MRLIFYLVISFLFLSTLGFSSHISFVINVAGGSIHENKTKFNIEILNIGDEPAFKIVVEPLTNFNHTRIFSDHLDPKNYLEGSIFINTTSGLKRGSYLIPILVKYSDSNGYSFSVITEGVMVNVYNIRGNVWAFPQSIHIEEKASKKLSIKVMNEDDKPHNVTIKIFHPLEIEIDPNILNISLRPSDSKDVDFKVTNLGGLYGSTYNYIVSIEYEDELSHYLRYTTGKIVVGYKNRDMFVIGFVTLIIIQVFLLVYLKIIYRSKWRRRRYR